MKNKLIACTLLLITFQAIVMHSADKKLPSAAVSRQDSRQDFSVWLIPAHGKSYDSVKNCIRALSEEKGIADKDIFEPHITIYWGSSENNTLANIRETVENIAKNNRPVTLNVAGIGVTRERFKSLFLTFSKEARLYEWSNQIANTADVIKNGYTLMPHLSLFYPKEGLEMPLGEKKEMMNYVIKEYPDWFSAGYNKTSEFGKGFQIVFDRLQVRIEHNENDVSSWKLLGDDIPLAGR